MSQSLAIKYRPKSWDDVTEQGSVVTILTQQISNNDVRNAYLFCGAAGTGKTTCARIFANEINHGEGNPIEMDAASHNSVDDVREIGKLASTMSMTSEYKVFIIDECHSLSNTAWQAMLKLIEEPPAKSIFIFCTTDPQKIPKTILSRVQRYNFQRISRDGVVERLQYIFLHEMGDNDYYYDKPALEYIARIADGGMRDAITLLDKCLAYSQELTLDNVLDALCMTDYTSFIDLMNGMLENDYSFNIQLIEETYASGADMKQFIRQYLNFILDVKKAIICDDLKYTSLPDTEETRKAIKDAARVEFNIDDILDMLIELNANIKYDQSPKYMIEASILQFVGGEKD